MLFEIGVPHALYGGLTLLTGAVLALALGWMRGRRAGFSNRTLALAALLVPLMTVFFSHLCYCLVCLPEVVYSQPFGFWFAFWQSGHLFYGGMLGAMLALGIAGGRNRIRLMESFAPSIALMTAFARMAEGFWGQGYGEYWYGEGTALCRLPFMAYDPYYEAWAWAIFMAEAAIALLLFAILLSKKPQPNGDGMLLFFGLYAAAQIVLESLRRDEFLRWGFVRVEELISVLVLLAVLILYWINSGRAHALRKAVCMAIYAAMVAFVLLLEFATEGRIAFLVFLDVWHCYALMAVSCAVMGGCVWYMRKKGALES